MITVKFVFSLLIAKNNEFYKTRVFCSVFLSGSDETIVRAKRSSGVILAIFVKSKKRASAPPRGRIYRVPELLYQSLKTWPGGTRCKKIFKTKVQR